MVGDPNQTQTRASSSIKKRNALHSLALAMNRRTRKKPKYLIKEVVKEVPVDKVAFRDVVKEVVKKEVIHVPIYTNDPNLVKDKK